jgi:hypothetical protein
MDMGTIELKSSIHKIVDSIQSEQLLKTLYDFLKSRDAKPGQLWETLTPEQKNEVLLAYEESEDDNNLIDSKDLFKK